jgi:hypothetical protein
MILASAGSDGFVRLWNWSQADACALAETHVSRSQIDPYLPRGWQPACRYAE